MVSIGAVLAVAVAGCGTATPAQGVSPPGSAGPVPGRTVATPLAGTATAQGVTWATVPMGRRDGHHDLFWQVFVRAPGASPFDLATPPAVASNGGLALGLDASRPEVVAGFGPSQGLRFSPLAVTVDDGVTWSPGGLSTPLAPAPSSLATSTSQVLALVGGRTPGVLVHPGGPSASDGLTRWRWLVTSSQLAATGAGRRCGIGSLTAVGLTSGGAAVVGASCARAGSPGLVVVGGSGWSAAPVALPASVRRRAVTVLRIGSGDALLAATRDGKVTLVATWMSTGGGGWRVSPGAPLATGSRIVATGDLGDGGMVAVVRRSGAERALVAGPGQPWRSVAVPADTATVATDPAGGFDALVVRTGTLQVLRPADGGWSVVQTTKVPIQYGSSA